MGRPQIHDASTKTALLVAAGRLLAADGPEAVTVRRLAEAVDVSTRAIYSLFGSKQGVVRALYRSGFEALDRRIAEVGDAHDPQRRLIALGLAYRQTVLERPERYDIMFACPFPEFEPDEDDRALADGTLDSVRGAVAAWLGEAARDNARLEVATRQMWALVDGLAALERRGALQDISDVEGLWREAIAALAWGLARSRVSIGGGDPEAETPGTPSSGDR